MFFERLPAYVANIDTLRFFYRKDMTTIQEAAIKTQREFRVLNPEALDEVRKLHDVACNTLGYFDERVAIN